MKKHILNLATLIFMQLSLLHSAEPGNPVPQSLQTPNGPDGIEASLKRLEEGSGGKTPTVKDFPSWVRTLTEHGKPKVYTRENSHNFDYIGTCERDCHIRWEAIAEQPENERWQGGDYSCR